MGKYAIYERKRLSLLPYMRINMEEKKKQERKVVHLQLGDRHLYYGSISRLFDDFTEDELGVSYYKTKNNLAKLGTITTDKCTIRQGFLITKEKKNDGNR